MIRSICFSCIICVLLLGACKEKEVEQPFSDKDMVSILTDMYLIEATITGKPPLKADSLRLKYREVLMEDYQMDSVDLKRMVKFLETHPQKSKLIHDKARNRIDQLQKSVN